MKNVTVKLEEELVRAARHEAVDAGQSLSSWLAALIRERLGQSEVSATVAEVMGTESGRQEASLLPFDEARQRALSYLDRPLRLDEDGGRRPDHRGRGGDRE